MTDPMQQELADEIEKLKIAFRTIHETLNQGQPVDLVGLDERVQATCKRIAESSDEMKQVLLPSLIELLDQLRGMETHLKQLIGAELPDEEKK